MASSPSCDHTHRITVSAPVNMKASAATRPNVDLFATLSPVAIDFAAPPPTQVAPAHNPDLALRI